MNSSSIHYFRAVCAFVLMTAFFFVLSSCASRTSNTPISPGVSAAPEDTGTVSSDASSEVSPNLAAPPSEPLTDRQIRDIYTARGFSVQEIRDAGAHTMVHYINPEDIAYMTSRFEWFDRKTGAREFVGGFVYTDKFEITADKTLTVLTTGLVPDGYQQFPRFLRFGYSDMGGVIAATVSDSDYYMPLEQGFTLGIDRPECLKSVCYDGNSMLLTFTKRPGYEQEFHADVEAVPKMTVTNENGVSTVTLFNTILSDNFVQTAGKLLGSNPCPVTVTSDGTDTTVTFKMHPDAVRYNVGCFTTPVERVPHAVITYKTGDFGYPKGW